MQSLTNSESLLEVRRQDRSSLLGFSRFQPSREGLFLNYTYELYKIYTGARSRQRKHLRHLREYNLKYLGLTGNVFHVKYIDGAIEKRHHHSSKHFLYSVGLVPCYGSSSFGVCILELKVEAEFFVDAANPSFVST